MTNALAVCLISVTLFCCTNLSFARQLPKECSKGPSYWCQSLKRGADCGAVGHCIGTVWEKQNEDVASNEVADKFVRLFRQLKDVKELINENYLATRVASACRDVDHKAITAICKDNTRGMEQYIDHVLQSDTTPEVMCKIIGMCNNEKINNFLSSDKKKKTDVVKPVNKGKLVGSSQCTWGPAYWCSNISTSHECKATHHCVSTVWTKAEYPHDNDGICKICTDMVQEARDQLTSNETQEELKEVFEGSCKLIPIKVVTKACVRLADEFVPELVETLSSQMNPQAVCTVAGLCNNAQIDLMLEDYNEQLKLRENCNNCTRIANLARRKFDTTSYEGFLYGLLQMCQKMDSLSDSCSMLVFKYYENIVAAVRQDLTAQSVCHASAQCAHNYHSHERYVFPEALPDHSLGDDVPCELCEQLVKHLRDVLVANTTELEFYKVLKGLCKQTGNFKDECLHIAEQYYPEIYKYLVEGLQPNVICDMMGMCGNTTNVQIAPLMPKELTVKAITHSSKLIGQDEANSYNTPKPAASEVQALPVERMFIAAPQGKDVCMFCQYFLHYLQVELSDTVTEDQIKSAVEKACDRLPQSVSGQCRQFVSQYGPAVIALLVQEFDPATVCPKIGLCPKMTEVQRLDANSDKSKCPLCLFAVEQLETMLKNNHSEESIRHALDNLCTHLSQKLRKQCVDFVDTYTQQLVEMLVANMNAEEICVFLKLCSDTVHDPLKLTSQFDLYHDSPQLRGDRNNFRKPMLPKRMLDVDGDIETNEIPDNTVNGRPTVSQPKQKTVCVLCEFVMKELDDEIKDKHNQDEIISAVHSVCKRMPKSVRGECDQFVQQYAQLVISLLAQQLAPDAVCAELKLCPPADIAVVKEEILDCAVCETVVLAVKKLLSNDKVDRNIVHIAEKSCLMLPAKYSTRCRALMDIYGESVIRLVEQFGVKGVCQKIGQCAAASRAYVRMYRAKRN